MKGDEGKTVSGTIQIHGGTIKATGGSYAAGIGTGPDVGGGIINILITGGTVTASGSSANCDIGNGVKSKAETSIFITGGTVNGKISFGETSKVLLNQVIIGPDVDGTYTAETTFYNNGFVFPNKANTNSAKVKGNAIIPKEVTITIEAGETLEIPAGKTLIVEGELINSGGTITNNGTIKNDGTITGIISGDGSVLYKVTYNYNYGEPITTEEEYAATISKTLTREGYTFKGWSETNNGNVIATDYKVEKATTLYAIWAENVIFNENKTVTGTVGVKPNDIALSSYISNNIKCTFSIDDTEKTKLEALGFTLTEGKLSASAALKVAKENETITFKVKPDNGAEETTLPLTFTIAKGNAMITWANDWADSYTYTGSVITVGTATVTAPSITDPKATVTYTKDNATVTEIIDAGEYTATASFTDVNYNDVTETKTFTVNPAEAILTWSGLETAPFTYGDTYEITATVSSTTAPFATAPEATLSYKVKDGDALQAKPTDAGTYVVTASFDNNNYKLTETVENEFTIAPATATITWNGDIAPFIYGNTVNIDAPTVTGAGLTGVKATLTYQQDQTGEYTTTVPASVGTHNVKASYAGDSNHDAANEVVKTFSIVALQVNIATMEHGTITASPTPVKVGEEVTLTITTEANYSLKAGTLKVTDAAGNDIAVTDNKFTMPASDVTVTAEFEYHAPYIPPVIPYYTVTLPEVEGATVSPVAGTHWIIGGSDFEFTITLDEAYSESTPVVTLDNGETITPNSDGEYIISDIWDDVEIFINGIELNDPTANETINSGRSKIWNGNGNLYILPAQTGKMYIVTMTGAVRQVINVNAGELKRLQLPKGIYIFVLPDVRMKVVL